MKQFPNGFLWGSSTSGPQSEGRVAGDGKGENTWDYWFSIEPDRFHGQVGPQLTSTFYEHYEKDIDLLVETGHTIFRTSIQWARLVPEGTGEVNQTALAFYRHVFQLIRSKGIQLMVNLYHFDLPMTLQEKGGWENRETVEAYERYARICFEEFSDVVDYWITFNEPIVPVECGYFYNYHYPNKVDAKAAVQVAYYTQLASSLAVRACHEVAAENKIGIVLNLTPAYPRSSHPAASLASTAEIAVAICKQGVEWGEESTTVQIVFLLSPSKFKNAEMRLITGQLARLIDGSESQQRLVEDPQLETLKQIICQV